MDLTRSDDTNISVICTLASKLIDDGDMKAAYQVLYYYVVGPKGTGRCGGSGRNPAEVVREFFFSRKEWHVQQLQELTEKVAREAKICAVINEVTPLPVTGASP